MTLTAVRNEMGKLNRIPDLGERHILCDWSREDDPDCPMEFTPWVEFMKYGKLLSLLPDKKVEALERARKNRDPRRVIIRAGLGYEEMLLPIIVDGSAIASSSTEAFLAPAAMIPKNYLQPNGIPGRTLRMKARGRQTTLTTAATLIFKWGAALTNVIPTTTWCVSGALTMDTTLQTATMWKCETHSVIRSVGSGGTVFAMGEGESAAAALTIANQTAGYMGSAGSATPAAVTVDCTADQFLSLTGKWSLSTAYSIQAHQFFLEALN